MSTEQKGIRYIKDVLEYSNELLQRGDYSNLSLKDIIGFNPPKGSSVFLPNISCVPLSSMLPLYDTIVVGIPVIKNNRQMKQVTGFSFEEIMGLSQRGKIVLYVDVDCGLCLRQMANVIQAFVDNHINFFFSNIQSTLLCLKTAQPLGIDAIGGRRLIKEYFLKEAKRMPNDEIRILKYYWQDMEKIGWDSLSANKYVENSLSTGIVVSAMIKPMIECFNHYTELISNNKEVNHAKAFESNFFVVTNLLLAKAFDATFSTNIGCRFFKNNSEETQSVQEKPDSMSTIDAYALEFVEKQLQIAYSEKISILEYSDLFDSTVTRSMRELFKEIGFKKPNKKSIVALQILIDDYNKQVNGSFFAIQKELN
jgi:hypothetical protein